MQPLEVEVLDRIEAIGAAKEKISAHWNNVDWGGTYYETSRLTDTSKHNEWFQSPHEEEFSKLDLCRRRLQYFEDLLSDVFETLSEKNL
jgi:hypothetical protein